VLCLRVTDAVADAGAGAVADADADAVNPVSLQELPFPLVVKKYAGLAAREAWRLSSAIRRLLAMR
jgi:hypothetical protein